MDQLTNRKVVEITVITNAVADGIRDVLPRLIATEVKRQLAAGADPRVSELRTRVAELIGRQAGLEQKLAASGAGRVVPRPVRA